MGKKNNKQLKEQRLLQKKEQQAQNKKQSIKVLVATLAILLAVTLLVTGGVLGGSALYNAYLDSGNAYRNIVSYKTEHYRINNAMLSFYFYDYLYSGVLDRVGADHPDELKEKFLSYTDEETGQKEQVSYFTYYCEVAAYDFQSDLLCAEAAADFGVTLDERDRTFIANRLKSIENSASALGLKTSDYIATTYGRGVKLSDIENALVIKTLAEKQYAVCYAGQEVSREEILNYLSSSNQSYMKVDYYLHIITIPVSASEEEKKALRDKADKLIACKSDEEFLAELKEQLLDQYGDEESFDVESEIQSTILSETVYPITDKTTDLDKFLYSPNSKQGDSYLSVGAQSLGVARILKEQYSSDVPLDTLRLIRFDYNNFPSKSDALSAMNALKKQLTGKSEEEFAQAAKNESHDRITAILDGLYLLDDESATVETLSAKKLADAKKGDLIEFSNDQSIWIAYYCGKGVTVSEARAEEAVRGQKFTKAANDLAEKYPMEFNTAKISRIAPLLDAAAVK